MVAVSSSRRNPHGTSTFSAPSVMDALETGGDRLSDSLFCNAASHRATRRVVVCTNPEGTIREVRIGRWRVVTSTSERPLREVRELSCGRVAVCIDRQAGVGGPSSEIWQLYDLDGRLDAAMQITPDGRFAMLTNYRTRQACRLMADGEGALQAVEVWKI